jgi:hypothetical protein
MGYMGPPLNELLSDAKPPLDQLKKQSH